MNSSPVGSMRGRAAVVIVVAVAVAAALGFLVQRRLTQPAIDARSRCGGQQPPPLQSPTRPLRPQGASIADAKVPEVLPQFELADRDGKLRKLADWAGRPDRSELLGHLVRALPPRDPAAEQAAQGTRGDRGWRSSASPWIFAMTS